MFSYKRDVLEKQSLSNLWKALQISYSANIIKIFREIWEIFMHKGQGWRPLLDARGLQALRPQSKFDILVGNHGGRILRAEEEGDLPACYQ